ncbi:MAG: SGNH/GDSL hydrolase family protein [Clostridia bacterium]|nr:SGNH/GDSL hydrolase family protein [Clostridia bacterium]
MEEIKRNEYVEVDKNMLIETTFPDAADAKFYSVREKPFELYNFYEPEKQNLFRRLPPEIADATSEKVAKLAKETAGGRVRFCTDSQYVLLRTVEPTVGRNSHMTLAMSAGFDLYEDTDADSRYVKMFMPPYKMEGGYEQIIRFPERRLRYLTINFPIHSVVSEVYIGLQEDAVLGAGKKYRGDKPVVVYGSSIVHGTAATRPGLIYTNILSRFLDMNVINLGFSGNAKAEPAIMEYIAGLDMSVFVYDYDHNAPNADFLRQTHKRGFDIVRRAQPDLPIILITRPNAVTNYTTQVRERKDIIIDTFRAAREAGDKNVYYIDGETFFLGKFENECTMDGIHPNDLGFTLMADGIESVIRRALRNKEKND